MENWIWRNKNGAGGGSTDNEADLTIGRHSDARSWDGMLDELRLWRKALTAKEAKQAWKWHINENSFVSGPSGQIGDDLGAIENKELKTIYQGLLSSITNTAR
mgnify:FL=1